MAGELIFLVHDSKLTTLGFTVTNMCADFFVLCLGGTLILVLSLSFYSNALRIINEDT